MYTFGVVFLPYPTSNRNLQALPPPARPLYFFLILHQTATLVRANTKPCELYFFLILHQTAT